MKDSDYVKINNVNPLYLITGEVDRCIEESNESKYLNLDFTEKKTKKY